MAELASQLRMASAASVQPSHESWVFAGGRWFHLRGDSLFVSTTKGSLQSQKVTLQVRRREQQLTKEEEMLRERLRKASSTTDGVDSFFLSEKSQQLVVSCQGSVLLLDPTTLEVRPVPVSASAPPGAQLHPDVSADAAVVSFVRNGQLFLTHMSSGREFHINEPKAHVIAGQGDFIHQEEFSAYQCHWISPASAGDSCYRVLYLESDESGVDLFYLPQSGIDGSVDPQRYAAPGNENAVMSIYLAVVNIADGSIVRTRVETGFPFEYIPRGGWAASGEYAWVVTTDRLQQHAHLCRIDLSGQVSVMYEERSECWINTSEHCIAPLYFFADGSILIASEISGFCHLYRLDPSSKTLSPLTSGEWAVQIQEKYTTTRRIWVRDHESRIFFVASKDSVLELGFYCLTVSNGQISRLSPANRCCSSIAAGDDEGEFIVVSSSLTEPFQVDLCKLTGGPPAQVLDSEKSVIPTAPFHAAPPKLFSISSNGFELHGLTYFPPDMDPSKRYPTVIYTYGGPHVQLVLNSFDLTRGGRAMRWQFLASRGYVVSVLDNRGSFYRGLKFEQQIYKRMGTVEIEDQVLHVQHLINAGYTDPARVAIYGSSYGGYMTLMAMAKRADIFKIGYSFCPVTLWEAYDTGYTERYMSLPALNPDGYKEGSVLTHANGFPNEPNRLLIFHGLCDENVHFCHTLQLVNELVKRLKPHDLQVYPDDRHGIVKGSMHSSIKMISHLFANL